MILKGIAAVTFLAIGLSVGAATLAGAQAPATSGAASAMPAPSGQAMLPERRLDCSLGRITNFDPKRDQDPSEYRYDGQHVLKLFLPSIAVRTTPPPEALSPAEPVDPRTRILADPDGISDIAAHRPFARVVDVWPSRVELMTPVNDIVSIVIVIAKIDEVQSSAAIFMARANDAVTYDLKNLYYGACRVEKGVPAAATR